jgi:GGDEF domain-containing protein
MTIEGKDTSTTTVTMIAEPVTEQCHCPAISLLHAEGGAASAAFNENAPAVPVTPELGAYLCNALSEGFLRTLPVSVLLLHVSQLEHAHVLPRSAILHKRYRYHAPAEFLEQVLATVRRTIRQSDQVIMHGGTGAAIIFPDVDQEGAFSILERAYYGINLLQSETFVPPLTQETDIFIGMGSYPKPASTLEDLLYRTGIVAHRLTLRPAVSAHFGNGRASKEAAASSVMEMKDTGDAPSQATQSSGVPYMQLPTRLPARLKHLIPYQLARELRCAPVGRDHHRLTVAMAYPNDLRALGLLEAATSMTIFPVSCETGALDTLLATEW